MKVFTNIMKVLAALAAVAGVVYLLAAYGDKLVNWAKGLCHRNDCFFPDLCDCEEECSCGGNQACKETPAEKTAPAEDVSGAVESDFEN